MCGLRSLCICVCEIKNLTQQMIRHMRHPKESMNLNLRRNFRWRGRWNLTLLKPLCGWENFFFIFTDIETFFGHAPPKWFLACALKDACIFINYVHIFLSSHIMSIVIIKHTKYKILKCWIKIWLEVLTFCSCAHCPVLTSRIGNHCRENLVYGFGGERKTIRISVIWRGILIFFPIVNCT